MKQTQEERELIRLLKFLVILMIIWIIVEMKQCSKINAAVIPQSIDYSRCYDSITVKSHGFKSYTNYKALTRKTSKQYKLQQQYAYTGDYGIRQVNGRFCIAVGTGVCKEIGQYIDVILENGTVIPCIMADQKADKHTDKKHITTVHNRCVCEFYLDEVPKRIKDCGDVSKACEEWQSPVCEFKVYSYNVFRGGYYYAGM